MLQITPLVGDLPADSYLVTTGLNQGAAAQLVEDISNLYLDDPTPSELGAAVAELGEDRDRLQAELEKSLAFAKELEEDLQEKDAELKEQKEMCAGLFDEAKEARREAKEAREEARAAATDRRKAREETEVLGKELAHAREERAKAEQDLSRALGYIDRVVEGEPPVSDPIAVVNRHVGDVGESFVSGPQRRGPVLGGTFRDQWR